jgi:DsbC/DsbD-like thiol-disulfide interchange protein
MLNIFRSRIANAVAEVASSRTAANRSLVIVLFVIVTSCFSAPNQAGAEEKPGRYRYPVSVQIKPTKADAKGRPRFLVSVKMEPNWVIYANPVENVDLEGWHAKLTITKNKTNREMSISYPEGEFRKDRGDWEYRVYKDTIEVAVTLDHLPEPGDLEFELFVWPFDEVHNVCIPPKTFKLIPR